LRVYGKVREAFGVMGSLGRKMLIGRIYPTLSKHEIGASKNREIVVRWQSETEGAAKELDRILLIAHEPLWHTHEHAVG
jgi:hypothetical protein